MGREITKGRRPFGIMQTGEMNRITREEMAKIGINIANPEQAVGTMSGGQKQTLAIARAIFFGARVLILDEPTSALGQKQQLEVLKTIKRVRGRGDIAIILITHNEIHAQLVADRYTFLSLGRVIGSGVAGRPRGRGHPSAHGGRGRDGGPRGRARHHSLRRPRGAAAVQAP